jgi:peptidoglycan/xylan/chitin deacetylase (PgdA/CDA1 family)
MPLSRYSQIAASILAAFAILACPSCARHNAHTEVASEKSGRSRVNRIPASPASDPGAGFTSEEGGIVRGPTSERKIALVFTGHEYAEGAGTILDELARRDIKAAFFVTGDFAVNAEFTPLVSRMILRGHLVGPHSNKHLLYCDWSRERTTLVSHDEFVRDLLENAARLETFGATDRFFLPAYEHYNAQIAGWARELGWTLVNFTPGTRSTADYTGENDIHFVSSREIFESIKARELKDPHGLNGFLLLLHLGAGPGRADKFHSRFGELLDYLSERGYKFVRLDAW